MYPVLFTIPIFGGVVIHSYGVMVALGFVVAMAWISRESRRLGQNPAQAMDLVFYVILAGIIGSRVLHVAIAERERFFANPFIFIRIWEGGLVFYGGLIASVVVSAWYVRRHRMPLLMTFDIFSPGLSLGHAIGRIGCFLAGCCYGRAVGHEAWFSVVFPPRPRTFAPTGVPLYPTQLMEVAGELIIFSLLVGLRHIQRFEGQIIATYLMLYAVLRTVVELFRGDAERGYVIDPWLSTSQFISIVMFLCGVALYIVRWGRRSGKGAEA